MRGSTETPEQLPHWHLCRTQSIDNSRDRTQIFAIGFNGGASVYFKAPPGSAWGEDPIAAIAWMNECRGALSKFERTSEGTGELIKPSSPIFLLLVFPPLSLRSRSCVQPSCKPL